MNQWLTGHVQIQQSMGSCLLYNESVANWACADNNPWAHVNFTINQWPNGHVQTQQSMGSSLLYNKSVANWACADTTIHGLMLIVQ